MLKKTILFFGVLTILLIINNCWATTKPISNYDANQHLIQALRVKEPGLKYYYGEITAITVEKLWIDCFGKKYSFTITPETLVYCNGMPSNWGALQPVAPNAYYETELYVGENGELRLVNAHYYGEECLLKESRFTGGHLQLTLCSVTSGEERILAVNANARIPSDFGWLKTDTALFVLFSLNGDIRAVYEL